MEINTFIQNVKKRKSKLFVFILIFLIVAATISFSQPLKYSASSRLLIIQEGSTSDPYTIAKSNQYIGSLLSEAVYSGSFLELLAANSNNIDWSYFSGNYKQQLKRWEKTISARNINDTGVMEINIYHPNSDQAKKIAIVVNNLIVTQNNNYQGSTDMVTVKVIDQPVVSSWPVKPNLPLNFGAALIFGLLFGLTYIYYFPKSKKNSITPIQKTIINNQESKYNYEEETENKSDFDGNIKNIIN